MRRLSALIIFISIAVIIGSIYLKDYASQPFSADEQEVQFTVLPGMSFKQLSSILQELSVIKDPLPWEALGRISGSANKIKAGEYSIQRNITPMDLLNKLRKGDTIQFSLTVIEGWTFNQLWEKVKANEKIKQTIKTQQELLKAINFQGTHPEGWFYPDTYFFPSGTTDVEFFQRAYQFMLKVLSEEWPNRQKDIPVKSIDEALILASIIEKETSVEDERDLVAAVFTTRLRRNMRLQTDPTVIYGMGENYNGNIRRSDLKKDTPYNTYVHKGLPPTPIALPGRASITAALNPAETDVLYFVSKGDGTHYFSKTYEEHKEAVIKYQLNGNSGKYKANHNSN